MGGMGNKGVNMGHKFRYISKYNLQVKEAYKNLIEILNKVQDLVRDKFTFEYNTVGSYRYNMITCDENLNVGFDIDVDIKVNNDAENYTAQEIKDTIRNALNRATDNLGNIYGLYHLNCCGYSYAKDNTRAITINVPDRNSSCVVYHYDFAIIHNCIKKGKSVQQYIHFNKKTKTYLWCNQSKGYYMISQKIKWLKKNGLWQELRDYYLYIKNANTNDDIHSRTLFAISVHEMCQKNGYYK